MSFKRAGNDISLLNLQKKRRLNEIMGLDIPPDEVAVMNDGRFTCLVCNAIPILDTIEILSIHRNSRKHKEKYGKFLKEKQIKLQLVEKRLFEAEQKGKDTTDLIEEKTKLLNKCKFSTKSHSKKLQPKLKVILHSNEPCTKDNKEVNCEPLTASLHSPSMLSRTSCLDKVTSIVHSPALEKLKEFSKLSESKKQQIVKNEMYLKSQGWLKDKEGNWVKDPNVEFDSDDDTVRQVQRS